MKLVDPNWGSGIVGHCWATAKTTMKCVFNVGKTMPLTTHLGMFIPPIYGDLGECVLLFYPHYSTFQ